LINWCIGIIAAQLAQALLPVWFYLVVWLICPVQLNHNDIMVGHQGKQH